MSSPAPQAQTEASSSLDASRPGKHAGRSVTRRETSALLLAAFGEVLAVVLGVTLHVPTAVVLALHVCVVAAVAAILFVRREAGADVSLSYIVLLLIAIAGPAGALVLVSSFPFVRARPEERDVVAAWYDRLARAGRPPAVTQTYERIVSGRVPPTGTAAPLDFLQVIRGGDLEQRQRALGLIARHFHPEYAPVLDAALRSTEPVVRVQAAAVVARVREDLKAKINHLARAEERPVAVALRDAGLLHALKDCSLVSASGQALCKDAVRRLMLKACQRGEDMLDEARAADRDSLRALETFLIDERRYKDLRVLRRVRNSLGSSPRVFRRRAKPRGLAA